MNKIWFVVLYVVWFVLFSMNINGAKEIALEGKIHPLAQLISLGITVAIFGVLLWALLHFRYKKVGAIMTRTDSIWLFLSAMAWFFSLVVLYRGLNASAVNTNNIQEVDSLEKGNFMTSLKSNVFGLLSVAGMATLFIGGAITYIYNIIDMFRNHAIMTDGSLFVGIAGVIFPPLGCIRGFLYLIGY